MEPPRATIAAQIRQALEGRTDIRVAVLFGSQARETARPDSDVDIAVIARDVDVLELGGMLSGVLWRDVDVVDLQAPPIPLLKRILKDGIVVHEGYRGAGASWRSKALCTLETDLPWFERMRDAWLERVRTRGLLDG